MTNSKHQSPAEMSANVSLEAELARGIKPTIIWRAGCAGWINSWLPRSPAVIVVRGGVDNACFPRKGGGEPYYASLHAVAWMPPDVDQEAFPEPLKRHIAKGLATVYQPGDPVKVTRQLVEAICGELFVGIRQFPRDPLNATEPGSVEGLQALLPIVKGLKFDMPGVSWHGESISAHIQRRIDTLKFGREHAARAAGTTGEISPSYLDDGGRTVQL